MQRLAIYGAGGFGRELACLVRAINEITPTWEMMGFFDDGLPAGTITRYGEVLGGLSAVNSYREPLAVAISIATPEIVRALVQKIDNGNVYFPNIIAPNVNFFDPDSVKIGAGNVIFFGCRISCDVVIGNYNIMNGSVSLGHDATLGSFNVLGPSVRISGNVAVGDENFFGVGAIVLQGKRVGSRTRIGANSVVMRNTRDNSLYVGNPAKLISV